MEIDSSEIAALFADLDHPDKPAIRAAVDKLIAHAGDCEPIRQNLAQRLIEPGHKNYWPVAYILGHFPKPSGSALRALLDALDHGEPDIRWAIALLLTRIAKSESAVVPSLIELNDSGTANQRRMAIYCLRDLALGDPNSLAALVKSLRDLDPTVRVAAVTSLKSRTDADAMVRQRLIDVYLTDADSRVRHAAAITLASYGSASEEFITALKAASATGDPQTKKAAEAALKMLQK